jgi:putative transposase
VRSETPSYKGFRYPAEIISHCVWLYHRFPLSFREVEEMMLQRGIVVSHETIRQWCAKFGQTFANGLRRRRPRAGDKWHLDEVFIKIKRQDALPLARGGPARHRARHPGHLPA